VVEVRPDKETTMTESELGYNRRRLLALRRRLGGDVRGVWDESIPGSESEAGPGSPDALTDRADDGVHEYEEQVDHALAGTEERLLEEVDAALDRIERGTFGQCGVCGRPIGQKRLRAVPYARFCATCALREEEVAGR
jgi:DnaK suppressor protein